MGDIADALIEDGESEWFKHLAGDCEDYCPYCHEEYLIKEGKEKKDGKRTSRSS